MRGSCNMRSDISSEDGNSSDDDVSLQEEKWDDFAIVRAFEDALTEKRNKAQQASQRPQNGGKPKPKSKAARTKSERKRSTASEAAPHEPAPVQQATFATQEELYQAAYAQAYAHLQQQQQQHLPQPMHHQAPPAYPPFGHSSMPPTMAAPSAYPSPFWQAGSAPSWAPPTGMPGMRSPPSAASGGSNDDLASLLLAWYQSGYYTGRYQAMQEMKGNANAHHFR